MISEIDPEMLSFGRKIQSLCRAPFYGHPKGCPNYGKKECCPPGKQLIDRVFDLEKKVYLIYTQFAVGEFAERMRAMHPEWKNFPRQWYNPRRWQPTARKDHRLELESFLEAHPDYAHVWPEACGVEVSPMMKSIGVELNWSWPPEHRRENKVYTISIGGYPLGAKSKI